MGVEHVRHAVDKDTSRLAPPEWLLEPRLPEPWSEGVLSIRRRVLHRGSAKVGVAHLGLCQRQGVAVVAAAGDLRTARHGIPGRVGPLDAGLQTHRDFLYRGRQIP